MNRDDIMRMMQEVGAAPKDTRPSTYNSIVDTFTRFAALVVQAERESCAKRFDDEASTWKQMEEAGFLAAIRRRGVASIRGCTLPISASKGDGQ